MTVTFDAGGHGQAPSPALVKPGDTIQLPSMSNSDGFHLSVLERQPGRSEPIPAQNPIETSMTLYAVWNAPLLLLPDAQQLAVTAGVPMTPSAQIQAQGFTGR